MVEMIIAIGIILTSTIATATLLLSTTSLGLDSQNKTIALNFAREGVEIVRGIRDSNWLKRAANTDDGATTVVWNDSGLTTDGPNKLGFDLGYTDLKAEFDFTNQRWMLKTAAGTPPIYWCPGSQLYSQFEIVPAGCTATKYGRNIYISLEDAATTIPYLNVVSTVSWSAPGGTRKVNVEERLYDWKP